MTTAESQLEQQLIDKLQGLKYTYRADIRDRAALEDNFRDHFEALNRVKLTDGEFKRLLDEIVTPDVFAAATRLREINSFIHKCVFVVDRKDLDRQTREEFNRFQENCVEENTNTAALVRRLLSDDYADKVIVTTIQKLGLALDEQSKRNQNREKFGRAKYSDLLADLGDKRMVFIFDECHRSQFGQTHQTIKSFFPKAQLFGFTGTPIFEQNATTKTIEDNVKTKQTTEDLFPSLLHAYTITHAIEDQNVLKFHVDYYTPAPGSHHPKPKAGENLTKPAVVDAILDKHDAATGHRRFNAIFATASINDAIDYFHLFDSVQLGRSMQDPDFVPLKIAAVFSPPADVSPDVKQIQEDLPQEQEDNRVDPDGKKKSLEIIIKRYNEQFGTNHTITEFDAYYQDVQKRIKDHKYPDQDLPKKGAEKVDLVIVVDMLLTGFDSKHLNTLYVDKNLKHHGLIQAFSRTNRILNGAKPYGHILDFRNQKDKVDEAITLFSGLNDDPSKGKEIWLVDKAPVVIEQLKAAKEQLDQFFRGHGLEASPDQVANLKGDAARAGFVKQYLEVQRLTNQLDQYTDLTDEQREEINQTLPKDDARAFRGVYLETAKRLKAKQDLPPGNREDGEENVPGVDQLDFEFVLFASADIDYDYIMQLLAKRSGPDQTPAKQEMTRAELIRYIRADSKFIDEVEEITEYVQNIDLGKPLTEKEVRDGYQKFRGQKHAAELHATATKHGLDPEDVSRFVEGVLSRMIFDGEQLTDLLEPLGLGWRDRREKELALMDDLLPLLKKRASGRDIAGLNAYEQ